MDRTYVVGFLIILLFLASGSCQESRGKGYLPPVLTPNEPAQSGEEAPQVPKPPAPAPSPDDDRTVLVVAPRAPRESLPYQRDLIRNARAVWGMMAPIATFAGQIHQESTWRADIVSHAGAEGLAQFMPATAKWIAGAYPQELGENQPRNPSWALRGLVRYDKHLWDRQAKWNTECDRMKFTLSDYNGGSGWRMKRQQRSSDPGSFEITGIINPGITSGNQRENQEYPQRIIHRWQPLYQPWGPGVKCP